VVFGHTDRNHVLLDVFAEVNASIEASGHNIETAVVSGDFELDVRVIARKLPQSRPQHPCAGKLGHQQAHAASRSVAQRGKLVEGI
jgi:hypothetical protein